MISPNLKLDKLFLHFFDTHFIEDKGSAAEKPWFLEEMRFATRLAIASADRVYIPAASYFESPVCRQVLDGLDDLVDLGFIALAGSAINLDEYLRERQDEKFYRIGSVQHSWYRAQHDAALRMPYERRKRSATRDVTTHWQRCVEDESLARKLRNATESAILSVESRLGRVIEEIGPLAFIPEHVFEILDSNNLSPLIRARIRSVINEGYFESYTRDLECGVVVDLHHLASDFQIPSYGHNLSYSKMLRFLRAEDQVNEFAQCSTSRLFQFGRDAAWQAALATSVAYVTPQLATTISSNKSIAKTPNQVSSSKETMQSVLCIAAADVEFRTAVQQLTAEFGNGKAKSINNGENYIIEFIDPNNNVRWNLAGQAFQGQVDAALNVSTIASNINPTITLMIGMCMGMPKKNLSVGTVIVPNEVIAYDHQRQTTSGIQFRPHGDRTHTRLHRLAQIVSASTQGFKVIVDKGLASASIKIENRDYELISKIEENAPDVVAFDMEGSGFYRGAGCDCLWVKAVADSGESQNSTEAGREEKHDIQAMATKNSVKFSIALVRVFFEASTN